MLGPPRRPNAVLSVRTAGTYPPGHRRCPAFVRSSRYGRLAQSSIGHVGNSPLFLRTRDRRVFHAPGPFRRCRCERARNRCERALRAPDRLRYSLAILLIVEDVGGAAETG